MYVVYNINQCINQSTIIKLYCFFYIVNNVAYIVVEITNSVYRMMTAYRSITIPLLMYLHKVILLVNHLENSDQLIASRLQFNIK